MSEKGLFPDFDFDSGYLLVYSCKNKFLAAEETGILYYRKPEYKRNPSRELREIEVTNVLPIKRSRQKRPNGTCCRSILEIFEN